VTDLRSDVTATLTARPYCVQFGETDFAFVSRLLEEEGIGYFFAHAAGAHTMVLFDDVSACPPAPGGDLPCLELPPGAGFSQDRRVSRVSTVAGLAPGKVVARDYAFETPATSLEVTIGEQTKGLYLYPGRHADTAAGQAMARRLLDAREAAAQAIEGETPWRPLSAGMTATLAGTPGGGADGSVLVRAVTRTAGDNAYLARFEAQKADAPWRPEPRTPRPRMAGPQTAVVVGSAGEEIWTDAHGRVKVQFPWDREGANDENSSCWLRVAQVWAGAGWGGFVLPRIGQEVLVSFLDGDPDRPLVTGVVYNGQNAPPYALPDMQTRTTLKSNSSAGGAGFNELRFEDKADEEEVYLHAAKDLTIDVVHDETVTIKNARTVTIAEGDESLTVTQGARTVKVEAGDETHEVGGKRTLKITGDETRTYEAKLTETVTGDYLLTVKGGLTIKVSGNVAIQADGGLNLKSGGAFSIAAGGAFSLSAGSSASISAGSSVEVTAGATLSLKGSASGEVDGGGMLTLKGGLVKVN
jgi:type VI secretion system secreted protein VgrG